VQNTLGDVATRTRVINRTLRDVSVEPNGASLPGRGAALSGILPLLAAEEDE
jgi:hypothetical protein